MFVGDEHILTRIESDEYEKNIISWKIFSILRR